MASFSYKARNRRGEAQSGVIEASTADEVAQQLFHSNLTPIDINEEVSTSANDIDLSRWFRQKVKLEEQVILCRQLYTLIKAGVPILRGLTSLAETSENQTLKSTLLQIVEDIQSGRELSMAMARFPEIFSNLFVSLVRVGESTGKLDQAFFQLADYLELERETRERIKTATRYPLVVIATIIMATVVINIWVIPAFADAFARFNAELPLMTRVLLASSEFMVTFWPHILLGLIGAMLGFRFWYRTERGNYVFSKLILKTPLVGSILKKAILGRFARALALSMKSGVPLVQALSVIAGVVNNAFVSERILGMRDGIERGDSIFRTAAATGLFTPLVLQMIAIGEETGAIDDLLDETAQHYEAEVKYDLSKLTDAIEPIIIVIVGIMVLVLALGVFMPMWDLSAAAHG